MINASDEELKCENVKSDLRENPYLELERFIKRLLSSFVDYHQLLIDLEVFRLRFILRYIIYNFFNERISIFVFVFSVLQVASFAGRMQALDEIHQVLGSTSLPSSSSFNLASSNARLNSSCSGLTVMNEVDLIAWFRRNELVDILFRDNLHHPVFVERLVSLLFFQKSPAISLFLALNECYAHCSPKMH